MLLLNYAFLEALESCARIQIEASILPKHCLSILADCRASEALGSVNLCCSSGADRVEDRVKVGAWISILERKAHSITIVLALL